MFEGSWNDQEGNISHEIIDFALTDNGKYYVYNIPYGCCPGWIHIKGDTFKDAETHEVEYLYLTSESRKGTFDLKYRIKLKRKLHSFSYHKSRNQKDIVSSKMEQLYEELNVIYGGKKFYCMTPNNQKLNVNKNTLLYYCNRHRKVSRKNENIKCCNDNIIYVRNEDSFYFKKDHSR
jgi:hypothetical protein